jgi:carbonic anhydrase
MRRRGFLAGLMACPACASVARAADHAPHWEYEGAEGPAKWGEMDDKFRACAVGAEQSPVDLTDAIRAEPGKLTVAWKPEAFGVVNNGHTIQLNAKSAGTLSVGNRTYTLAQFHFHTPSEHAINGQRSSMEAHFVHAAPDGRLAVLGVLMLAGKKHAEFAEIMARAPKTAGEAQLAAPLNAAAFLPPLRDTYRYEGSLTTPPCSEVVDWTVFGHTIAVAQTDIDAFKAIFPMNARPLQPLNRRYLLRQS